MSEGFEVMTASEATQLRSVRLRLNEIATIVQEMKRSIEIMENKGNKEVTHALLPAITKLERILSSC